MKKMRFLLGLGLVVLSLLLGGRLAQADDVDYSIPRYAGHLTIHEDNTATYMEQVTYAFETSYNGQYLSLGSGGNMPAGFSIGRTPEVRVSRNDMDVTSATRTEFEDLSDGVRLKIYNAGSAGDRVQVTVIWTLTNILEVHQDVAELNWVPISDWDRTLQTVELTVTTDKAVSDHGLWSHRGNFSPNPSVAEDGASSYTVTASNVSGILELHGYWDREVVTVTPTSSKETKAAILQTERNIVFYRQVWRWGLAAVLPALAAIFLLVAFLLYRRVWQRFSPIGSRYKGYHFGLPSELSPLLVAKQVYDLDLGEISPPNAIHSADIKLEHYVQAELLDLISQGKYRLSDDSRQLLRQEGKELTNYEESFLIYLFGELADSYALDSIFEDYQADKKQLLSTSLTGEDKRREINRRGDELLGRLRYRIEQVDQAIDTAFSVEDLPHYRRALSAQDLRRFWLPNIFLGLSLLIALPTALFSLLNIFFLGLGTSGLIVVLGIVLVIYSISRYNDFTNNGTLNMTYQTELQLWQGFRNMLRDIKTFDRAELESIIVWEKVLVYASLFGYAKRVREAIQVQGIDMPAQVDSMDVFMTYHLSRNISNLNSYSHAASQASNFTLPSSGSGGSGGGFSSGGFSGGGGGGGGGAF